MRVAVVGAGPAGAYLAYRLGREGVRVSLYDKRGPWEKPCGGGVPPKVRERFAEVDACPEPRRPVSIGVFISPGGREVELVSRRPMWVFSRKLFDGYLRGLALAQKNVEFRRERVTGVTKPRKRWRIETREGGEPVDLVVGCDGALSGVRRAVDKPIPKRHIATTGGYFVKASDVEVARTQFLGEGGYMWAFPRTDHVCVGGGSAEPGWDIFGNVDRFRERYFPTAKVLAKWGAPIPFVKDPAFYDRPIAGDGWALCGDAAGHVDAITGEGILYAIWGASLCADAVLDGRPASYEERWREAFGGELKKAARMSRIFYAPGFMEKVFGVAARSRTLREFLMDIMTDQPSYLKTGAMLRRRALSIALEMAGVRR